MLHRCIAVECFNARKDGVSYHWPDDLRYAKLWTNAVKNLTHTESTNSTRPCSAHLTKDFYESANSESLVLRFKDETNNKN